MIEIPTSRRALLLGAGAGAVTLGGCSLLSAPKPVPLYRFGQSAGQGGAAAATSVATVLYAGSIFPRGAAGDRIMTTTGVEVSYVAGSRWSAPALNLFDEAVLRGFQGSPVRLLNRGSTARADATLRVEVRTFEARYPAPDVAPTVVVETRALLSALGGSGGPIDAVFDAQRQPAANRVTAIAQAFDEATADVVARLVAWTASRTPASRAA